MQPGPDQVIECPKCKTPAKVFTLLSGNTFGARLWTDGKMIAPMLPQPPIITRCKGCGGYFWTSEAPVLGYMPEWGEKGSVPDDWKNAEHIQGLFEAEILEAIGLSLAHSREQEIQLRILAWWASNDPAREHNRGTSQQSPAPHTRSAEAIQNMERLVDLLNPLFPNERLWKAELMRDMGRFEDALRLLDQDLPEDYARIVIFIKGSALMRDPALREIDME